jgi:DNA-binding PadR family transcriptional regulator
MKHDISQLPTLSAKEAVVLQLLVSANEMYGLELVAASNRRLKRGTVYVTLGRMEEKGYVTSRREDHTPDRRNAGSPVRRLYQATALGRRVRRVWAEATRHLRPEFAR